MNLTLRTVPAAVAAALLLAGCTSTNPRKPVATDVDPKLATADYWLNQPAVATVTASDFDQLFEAAERVARNHYFSIDLSDRREGIVLTQPSISKQFFEIWRDDTGTAHGTLESSIASMRRTLSYTFAKDPNGVYTLTPKVLVEKFSSEGHRITVPHQAPFAFDPPSEENDPAYRHYPWPATYWFATGRDTALEKQIAHSIQSRFKS